MESSESTSGNSVGDILLYQPMTVLCRHCMHELTNCNDSISHHLYNMSYITMYKNDILCKRGFPNKPRADSQGYH